MLRPIAMRPYAAARAAPRGTKAATPLSSRASIIVARPPLLLRSNDPRSPSNSSLQLCFAEPDNKKPQTKEEKDKAMEQKEKLVKCE